MRSLGMIPVLPAFSGNIPKGILRCACCVSAYTAIITIHWSTTASGLLAHVHSDVYCIAVQIMCYYSIGKPYSAILINPIQLPIYLST